MSVFGPTLADLPSEAMFETTTVTADRSPSWIIEYPAHWSRETIERLTDDVNQQIASGSSVVVLPDGVYFRSASSETIPLNPLQTAELKGSQGVAALSILALLLSVAALVLALAR